MNVWDLATVVGIARIAAGLIVIGVFVVWASRHHKQQPIRLPARKRHDRD